MLSSKKYGFVFLIACLAAVRVCAQVTPADSLKNEDNFEKPPQTDTIVHKLDRFAIGKIMISGNKRTRAHIILREISFMPGEVYPLQELLKKFQNAKEQLMNTALFHSVVVAAQNFDGHSVNIIVIVKERWYLFPLPYFKPVDRNLNQWLVQQKASLNRVNFGGKLLYNNTTGRNDKLRLWLVAGYTRQVSVSYDRMYIDKALKWGMKVSFAAGKNHEVNYNTIDDKQVFLKDRDRYLRSFINSSIDITYRRAIKTRHSFGVSFNREEVLDTVIALNPYYFKDNRRRVQYPEIYYNMSYFDLDYIPYPTRGYAAAASISKRGLNRDLNMWQLSARGMGSWPLSPKMFFNLTVFGGIKLPFRQPFYNQRFLGYGDVFMQGYEYYVVDGVAGGFAKTTLTRQLLNFNIRIPPIKKGKEAERIPVKIFGKVFGNAGYVHNPQPGENSLSNQLLTSGGIGIDILTFYDVTFKLEWTFNQLGQNGIFLHRKTIF